nr:MAG TPA: hypothetical protein [Caudoviricetes sp.]
MENIKTPYNANKSISYTIKITTHIILCDLILDIKKGYPIQ